MAKKEEPQSALPEFGEIWVRRGVSGLDKAVLVIDGNTPYIYYADIQSIQIRCVEGFLADYRKAPFGRKE